jgi:hypothetical protein
MAYSWMKSNIWGIDCTDKISKAHIMIYKRLLYLPSNTPSYAVSSETGVNPIELKIIKRCISWWIKILRAPNNSFIKLCYNQLNQVNNMTDNWAFKFKNKIIPVNCSEIWNNQNLRYNDANWQQILNFHKQNLQETYNRKISESTSLYWYKDLLRDNTNLLYLNETQSSIANTFCQIRLLNIHNEKIYVNGIKYTFNYQSSCTICNFNEPDTLQHLIFNCNITKNLREYYLTSTNTKEEFLNMLNSSNNQIIRRTVNFVKQSLRLRSFVLNE